MNVTISQSASLECNWVNSHFKVAVGERYIKYGIKYKYAEFFRAVISSTNLSPCVETEKLQPQPK